MTTYDPYAAAVEDAEKPNFVWGQVQVTARAIVLVKGQGKVPFDPQIHRDEDRVTSIELILNPMAETRLTKLITRESLSNSRSWAAITWASLRDNCGMRNLRELDGKFAKMELVKSGRKWTDKKSGEEREETAMKFHAIFADEATAHAAWIAENGDPVEATNSTSDAMAIDMSPQSTPAEDPGRATALAFLPALVASAQKNRDALKTLIASMPPISKYFTIDSPEVAALLA